MSIRRDPIYISSDVYRWLRLLAKAEGGGIIVNDEPRGMATADEIADQILRESIREQHPTLIEGLRELEKMEKKIVENLKHEKPPIPSDNEDPSISRTSDKAVKP